VESAPNCAQIKKTICLFGLALLVVRVGGFAQETHPGGIVYGPKAAFKIDAPPGWVLDNSVGVEQGLPCVLYPKGSTWADANTIMYAKIASTQYEDVGKFVANAIQQMEKVHGKPKEKVDTGKTGDGQPYFINEYPATKSYSQWERVAYIQLPKAVAYIVFSARDEASYRKNFHALNEVLKSFAYMKVEGDHKQN
jgi:hypothetical protein